MINPLISPSTTIKILQNVPLDNNYNDTILFASENAQQTYFNSKVKKTYTGLTYQRLSDKSNTWAIFLEDVADYFYDCNYIMFCNTGFSSKWFFCFISDILYINENCSAITFEIDVFQTWMFNFKLKESFIERSHVGTDLITENLVPENVDFEGRYIYRSVQRSKLFDQQEYDFPVSGSDTFDINNNDWVKSIILVATAEDCDKEDETLEGQMIQQTYQGLKYIGFLADNEASVDACNKWLYRMNQAGKAGAIVTITMIPRTGLSTIEDSDYPEKLYINPISGTTVVAKPSYTIHFSSLLGFGDPPTDYIPKNNKLYCYPYNFLTISTGDGQEYIFKYEDIFKGTPTAGVDTSASFIMRVAFGTEPTYFLYPLYYKGAYENFDGGIKLTGYPVCNWIYGAYENWYGQNGTAWTINNITSTIKNVIQGGATGSARGVGGAIAGAAVSGIESGLSIYGTYATQQAQPNQSKGASNVGGVNFNLNIMDYWICEKQLHIGWIYKLDNFFWKYGYQINSVGDPNLYINNRKYWNYIKLQEPSIIGNMPVDYITKIKSIFTKGITLWHTTDVGNYELNNNEGIEGH